MEHNPPTNDPRTFQMERNVMWKIKPVMGQEESDVRKGGSYGQHGFGGAISPQPKIPVSSLTPFFPCSYSLYSSYFLDP